MKYRIFLTYTGQKIAGLVFWSILVIFLILGGGLLPVYGSQENPLTVEDLFEVSLEELFSQTVVTATKCPRKLIETPATVRVVSSEQIRERGYKTLEDILSDLPGIQFRNIQGFNSYVFMRGAPSQNNLILLLVDGIEINELNSGGFYGGGQFNIDSIKKVEIVYGPASTLYGTNAMSGIINIITREPEDKESQGVWVGSEIGSLPHTYKADFRMAAYDEKKKVGYSISGMVNTTEKTDLSGSEGDNNWTENMENFEDTFACDGKFVFHDLTVGVLFQNKEASRTTNYKTVGSDKRDHGTIWHITFANLWLKYPWEITEGIVLNSLIYYRDTTVRDDTIAYITTAQGDNPGEQVGYYRPNSIFGVEEQINVSLGERLGVIGGVAWEKERLSVEFSKTFSNSENEMPPSPEAPDKETNRLASLYLQSQYAIASPLEFTFGVRWDDSNTYENVTTSRYGLVYHKDKVNWKLLYSEAYRAPKPWDYTYGSKNPDLKPEEMKSYEASFGYLPFHDLHVEVCAYYNEIGELLVLNTSSNRYENKNTSKTTGVEITVDYTYKQLTSYVNYTFNHSEDEDSEDMLEIARDCVNLGGIYTFGNGVKLNVRGNYSGKRKNPKTISSTGKDEIDSYMVFHGDLSKRFGDWYLHLGVNNIFDTTYYHTSNRPPERYRQAERNAYFKVQYEF